MLVVEQVRWFPLLYLTVGVHISFAGILSMFAAKAGAKHVYGVCLF
jgi:hypothetical protein